MTHPGSGISRISVVIPTHNRRERLLRVLEALEEQRASIASELEIVVADDASTDDTLALARARWPESDERRYVSQPRSGAAAARNVGARAASGQLLVFIDDDIVAQPGFLAAHERHHREPSERPLAVLGYTTWDPSAMRITPFLTHLNEWGYQYGFSVIGEHHDPEDVPFQFFYTSNVSLRRDFFWAVGGFDEAFSDSFEDNEFGYRASLEPHRMRLVYRPDAAVLHDRPTTVARITSKLRLNGRASARLAQKYPELRAWVGIDELPRWRSRRPPRIAAAEAAIRLLDPLGVPLPTRVYDPVLHWHVLAGLSEGVTLHPLP